MGEHMGQGIVHADNNVELLGKSVGQGAEVCVLKMYVYIVLRGALSRFLQFDIAYVRCSHLVAQRSNTDGLSAYSAGAIKNSGIAVEAAFGEKLVENQRLLMCSCLPIEKQLIIVSGKIIVKSLRDIHSVCSRINNICTNISRITVYFNEQQAFFLLPFGGFGHK